MMNHFMAIVIFGIAAVMIAQQFVIAWAGNREEEDWNSTANHYVFHRYRTSLACSFIAILGFALSMLAILLDGNGWLADQYISLFKKENLVIVLGVGLLAAIFRHQIDRKVEQIDAIGADAGRIASTKSERVFDGLRKLLGSNIWLCWFVASYVLTLCLTVGMPSVTARSRTMQELRRGELETGLEVASNGITDIETKTAFVDLAESESPSLLKIPKLVALEAVQRLESSLSEELLKVKSGDSALFDLEREFEKTQKPIDDLNSELGKRNKDPIDAATASLKAAAIAVQESRKAVDAAENKAKGTPDDKALQDAVVTAKATAQKAQDSESDLTKNIANLTTQSNVRVNSLSAPKPNDRNTLLRNKVPAILIAFAIWAVIWFSWYRWVYTQIRSRLRDKHLFRGPAVNEFMKQKECKIPRQIVVIGPKNSGKSKLVQHWSNAPYAERESLVPVFRKATVEDTLLSICDMPGENLGDQINYLAKYRADWLVIVLRANAFLPEGNETEAELKKRLDKITSLHNLPAACVHNSSAVGARTDAEHTRDYFTALKLVLKQTGGTNGKKNENEENHEGQTDNNSIFSHVKRILLVLNYQNDEALPEKRLALEISEKRMLTLGQSIVATSIIPNSYQCRVASVVADAPSLLNVIVPSVQDRG